MDDDFNTAGATGAVFGLVTAANTYLDQAQGRVDAQACRLAADVIEEHAFVPEGADAQA